LAVRRETLREQRRVIPERIRVGGLEGKDVLDVLPEGERLLLDLLRMIAYRAETAMMPAVAVSQGKVRRPRRVLKALMQADADIVPDHVKGELRVRILGTASDAGDKYIRGVLEELTGTETCFPETSLRMVCEICG